MGCAVQNYLSNKNSGLLSANICGFELPSTNVMEKQVIFGGGSRLREQLKNTVKVLKGKLYVTLGSCESAMVGDDVAGMAREAREEGRPVVASDIAGFHGAVHHGYARVFKDLINSVGETSLKANDTDAPIINVFGVIPKNDIFFKGDIMEIRRVLEGIGLTVNAFFGYADGAAEIARIKNAALSVSFSKWGAYVADAAAQAHGTPALKLPSIPMGYAAVEAFLMEVAKRTGVSDETADRFLRKEKEKCEYFANCAANEILDVAAGKTVVIVGDESAALRYGGFITETFGADIKATVITDRFLDEGGEIDASGLGVVRFSSDQEEIAEIIKDSGADIALGSSLEREAAESINAAELIISYPSDGGAILSKTHAGIEGAFTFTEDFLSAARQAERRFNLNVREGLTRGNVTHNIG
jgi:nitrogenase molybdenum-iron protein beta chain